MEEISRRPLARTLRADADDIRALARPVRAATGPDVLSGSRLAESVDELIRFTESALRVVADRVDDFADEFIALEGQVEP